MVASCHILVCVELGTAVALFTILDSAGAPLRWHSVPLWRLWHGWNGCYTHAMLRPRMPMQIDVTMPEAEAKELLISEVSE
jgi:hypothetical protein